MNTIKGVTLRVYGIVVNEQQEVLLSHERLMDRTFTKFPGGGHEPGEGLRDTVVREFKEELKQDVEVKEHFYTTDFFQPSAFHEHYQVISIYFLVQLCLPHRYELFLHRGDDFPQLKHNKERVIWKSLKTITDDWLTFPIDRLVLNRLKDAYL